MRHSSLLFACLLSASSVYAGDCSISAGRYSADLKPIINRSISSAVESWVGYVDVGYENDEPTINWVFTYLPEPGVLGYILDYTEIYTLNSQSKGIEEVSCSGDVLRLKTDTPVEQDNYSGRSASTLDVDITLTYHEKTKRLKADSQDCHLFRFNSVHESKTEVNFPRRQGSKCVFHKQVQFESQ